MSRKSGEKYIERKRKVIGINGLIVEVRGLPKSGSLIGFGMGSWTGFTDRRITPIQSDQENKKIRKSLFVDLYRKGRASWPCLLSDT
jgi:hypothetical protein